MIPLDDVVKNPSDRSSPPWKLLETDSLLGLHRSGCPVLKKYSAQLPICNGVIWIWFKPLGVWEIELTDKYGIKSKDMNHSPKNLRLFSRKRATTMTVADHLQGSRQTHPSQKCMQPAEKAPCFYRVSDTVCTKRRREVFYSWNQLAKWDLPLSSTFCCIFSMPLRSSWAHLLAATWTCSCLADPHRH